MASRNIISILNESLREITIALKHGFALSDFRMGRYYFGSILMKITCFQLNDQVERPTNITCGA